MDNPKFTDEWEWKEYLDKIFFLLPMNGKEWAEWCNPKAKFYPNPNEYYRSIKFQIHRDFDLTKFK